MAARLTASEPRQTRLQLWLTVGVLLVACAPALVFRYLPMTDLPQHEALASIIEHHDDPRWGYAQHYEVVSPVERPYGAIVYFAAIAIGKVTGLHFAMNFVAFLSILAYPVGVLLLLCAARKPPWLALLAVPLIYHRTVFWGFVSFDLAVGFAFAAFALHIDPTQSRRRDIVQAVLALVAVSCHVYGLVLLGALVGGNALLTRFKVVRERPWNLAPVVLGALLWVISTRDRGGYGLDIDPPILDRIEYFVEELLGGYQDSSEHVILGLFVAAWLLLAWPALPTSRAKLRSLTTLELVAYAGFYGNLMLYFLAPSSTWSAKYINVRHLFLAFAFLPLVARDTATTARFLRRAVLGVAAFAAAANAWVHFLAFNREARGFDQVIAALPQAPKVLFMDFDPKGRIMASVPYLHFPGYIQAEKGGLISSSFPMIFWNVPVRMNATSPAPKTAPDFEWNPLHYNEKTFGYYYDYALIRMPHQRLVSPNEAFPFELVLLVPPWQLYARKPAP